MWYPEHKARWNGFHTDVQVGAHRNMAANIDQIFQDFILNKIKEIQGRHEAKTYAGLVYLFVLLNVYRHFFN